jgi:hypothetical protein
MTTDIACKACGGSREIVTADQESYGETSGPYPIVCPDCSGSGRWRMSEFHATLCKCGHIKGSVYPTCKHGCHSKTGRPE